MFTKLNINKYLEMGGLLDNLDLTKTTTFFNDEHNGKPIRSIKFATFRNDAFFITYEDGSQKVQPGIWINTHVHLVLSSQYTVLPILSATIAAVESITG